MRRMVSKKRANKITRILFLFSVFSFFLFIFNFSCYALNLDKLKISFLSGDYKQAIKEGELVMANAQPAPDLDELYYILGLSYLKDGNLLRASDIFEIILNEFKGSKFTEEAMLGLGDTYFFRGNFLKAGETYTALLKNNKNSKYKPDLYYRLSQVSFKTNAIRTGNDYLSKLEQEFPMSNGVKQSKMIGAPIEVSKALYYTVQVGCFANRVNAKNIVDKLSKKGYSAYIEELSGSEQKIFRVRVGKVLERQEAVELESKLSQEGYPTKIYP